MAPGPASVGVVARDPTSRRRVGRLLRHAGHGVIAVADGAGARRKAAVRPFDLVVYVPAERQELSVLGELRDLAPALVVVAAPAVADVVDALDAGADDYLAEPVNADELWARVRALLRRGRQSEGSPAPVLTADFTVDVAQRRLTRGGREVHLTPTEWRILELLATRPDRVVSHERLLGAIWGPGKLDKLIYLRVYVAALRRKLEPDRQSPRYLITLPGFGYQFRPAGDAVPESGT